MPPLPEPRVSQTSSSPHGDKNDSHNTAALRCTVEEALTNFVTDTMYDKPEDLLQYMADWARKRHALSKEQRTSLSPTPPPRGTTASRHAPRGASAEPTHPGQSQSVETADTLDDAADQLMSLAQHRHRYLRDKAEGCRDHYLISLEDSDGDIFHADALQKKMAASRKEEMDAETDAGAVAAQLKEIEDSDDSESIKAQRKMQLLREYQHKWVNDLPPKH